MNKIIIPIILLVAVLFQPYQALAYEKLFYYYTNVYGLTNFKKNFDKVDTIAPQVYVVGDNLKVKAPSDKKILKEAKKKQAKIVPLIVNKGFDKVLMSSILINPKAQDEIIDFMIKEAKKQGFAGWQFDFENINHMDRDMYTDFVAKTYERMQDEGLEFSVAVITRNTDYDPNSKDQDWSSAYDYEKLAQNSDFISTMMYDDPNSVGPVASLPFVNKNLNYLLTKIPAEKLSLGIPLYCWKWDESTGRRVGSTTPKLASKMYSKGRDKEKGYDEGLGAMYYSYQDKKDKSHYKIWCENPESIEAKISLIEEKGLRGFSAWAIGQEDTWFWRTIGN